MQDLNDMLYFAEVVEKGSFAAAGRSLGLPKSKLSRRVAELESRLGVRLLQRTTRKLSLTEAGELFHRHCADMRDAAQAADEAVALVQTEPRGTIRVACPITLAQSTVGRVVPMFLERYPGVRIDMRVSNRVVDLVEEGIDVALRVRATLEDSGSLVVKQLGPTHGLLVAGPALLARQGVPASVDDLARLDTVSMSAVDGKDTWHLLGPGNAEHALVHHPRYVVDDVLTVKAAAIAGIGMCLLPDYMCSESLANGRLVQVLPGWGPRARIVHAVFPSRRGLVPAVRRFLDFLGEHMCGEQMLHEAGVRPAP
ncbi:MAG: LysR family transcriptional regulator [Betaproteobacteria bacterium]|nr:LysR family transcriptional regulator [Betaproteobacteria bacterium]